MMFIEGLFRGCVKRALRSVDTWIKILNDRSINKKDKSMKERKRKLNYLLVIVLLLLVSVGYAVLSINLNI